MTSDGNRRVRRDAVANRDRVLDAATVLFHSEGQTFTTAAVAAQAGVGVGTVYRHFPTREDLLGALVTRSFERVRDNARAAAKLDGTPIDGIRAFMHAALRDREHFVLPLRGAPAIFDQESRALQSQVRSELDVILQRGRSTSTIRDDITPVDIVIAGSLLSQPLPNIEDWDTVALRQIELFLAGLGSR